MEKDGSEGFDPERERIDNHFIDRCMQKGGKS